MLGVGFDISQAVRGDPAARLGFARAPDLHADFVLGDYRIGGVRHGSKSTWLTAAGGAANGAAYDFGPAVVGPELIVNGTFDTDVAGWSVVGGLGTSVVSWQAPGRMRNTAPGAGQQRIGQSQTRVFGRAYLYRATAVRVVGSPILSNGPTGGGTANGGGMSTAGDYSLTWAEAAGGTRFVGLNSNFSSADNEEFDNVSLSECQPFAGFDAGAWAFMMQGVAGGAMPGSEQVILSADADSPGKSFGNDSDRVRLAWATNGDLKLVVTRLGVEQVNMVVGVLAPGAAFTVRASLAANAVVASLNDAAARADVAVSLPALAYLRLGRSRAGERSAGPLARQGCGSGIRR